MSLPLIIYRSKDNHEKALCIELYCPTLHYHQDIKVFKRLFAPPPTLKVPHNSQSILLKSNAHIVSQWIIITTNDETTNIHIYNISLALSLCHLTLRLKNQTVSGWLSG